MLQVIRVKPHRNCLIVTLESERVEQLAGSRGRRAARATATEYGYRGRVEMHSNLYFVDRTGRIKKDVSPFAPGNGDRVRIECRVCGERGQRPSHDPVTPPSP